MLAPRTFPQMYYDWNRANKAPFGYRPWYVRQFGKLIPENIKLRILGPFCIQPNSNTRLFEYPWAFHSLPIENGMDVLEIGGGLSGFQFVLSRCGCQVVNIDPGLAAKGVGWKCDPESISKLNALFHTDVVLKNSTIKEADIESNSIDRTYSISTLEHLPASERISVMRYVYNALKPGGHFLLIVDLFLDLVPFTTRSENKWGSNANIQQLTSVMPFDLKLGDRSELYGFEEFDTDRIQCNLANYLIGEHPVLTQCLILEKPVNVSPVQVGMGDYGQE